MSRRRAVRVSDRAAGVSLEHRPLLSVPDHFTQHSLSQRRLARTLLAAAFLLSPASSSAFTAAAPPPAQVVVTRRSLSPL